MIDFSVTFFITIINIFILFFILRKILFKPVTKFMDARTNSVKSNIEQAEKDRTQAKLALEQYENRLKNAGAEGDALIKEALETGQREAERIIAEGKAEAETLVNNARKQIEAEQSAAMALFKAEAAALVISASGRLLRRELGGAEQLRYASEALEELGK
jgi:F-type H+-transporting ATPase subunit b